MKTLSVGQHVVTKVQASNYNTTIPGSKYYYGPANLNSGIVGIVGDKAPCVRLRRDCKCQYFYCLDFKDGARAAYHLHELQAVADMVI